MTGASLNDFFTQQREWDARASQVQAAAAQAYNRLLLLAENREGGQARTVAQFVASTHNSHDHRFDLWTCVRWMSASRTTCWCASMHCDGAGQICIRWCPMATVGVNV